MTSPALLPLHQVNWDSHTCECKVEVRRYHIYKTPSQVIHHNGALQFVPERIWCHLHKLDGSITDIPMRVTTIDEMLKTGLQQDYWKDAKRRNLQQVEKIEEIISDIEAGNTPLDSADPEWLERFGAVDPEAENKRQQAEAIVSAARSSPGSRDLEGWQALLHKYRTGKTYADLEGYRRSPGTQMRGHLSSPCARHHNQTDTSLMEQEVRKDCGCVIGQITVGETRTIEVNGRRELNLQHEIYKSICDFHRDKMARVA